MTASAAFSAFFIRAAVVTRRAFVVAAAVAVAACGGSAEPPPPPEARGGGAGGGGGTAPTITQQPQTATVTAGQPASFTVAATGTAPLVYQWQRAAGGSATYAAIAGATSTTYSITATVLGDSGAVFRAVVSNAYGSATSNKATLTVTASAPVLTITPQPANTSVVVGAMASFTVGGTCSSGTLGIQWQRGAAAGMAFSKIAGATAATYSFMAVLADSGAQFRAVLDCSGQSSTPSSVATLTVNPPGSVTLSLLPLVGLRAQADISFPRGIDAQPDGTFVFTTANRVKRLSADRLTIELLAGGDSPGATDGPAATAQFRSPSDVTHDAAGNLYVADTGNHTIRRIAADGSVTTIAGSPLISGTTDGIGSAARFSQPTGIAIGPDGDLYVGDVGSNVIRRVTTSGTVTTYAGSPSGGAFVDGLPTLARFSGPVSLAVAANGDVLVADRFNNRVRRVVRSGATAGTVETLAGSGFPFAPSVDGIGTAAIIVQPNGIDVAGNVATLRDAEGLVRQIDLTTTAVTTLTGSRTLGAGVADGTSAVTRLTSFGDIAGAAGGGYVTVDGANLRFVSAAGDVKTLAAGNAGPVTPAAIGTLPQEPFDFTANLSSLGVDPAGTVVVANDFIKQVRRVDNAGVVTLVAGNPAAPAQAVDGIGSAATFAAIGIASAVDDAGVLYLNDGYAIRRIGTGNAVRTLAGSAGIPGAVDGNGPAARFGLIDGLAVGLAGDVFAADVGNAAVRRVDAAGNVTTYAGALGQSALVDGPIAAARFIAPTGVARAPDGALYVVDFAGSGAAVLRKVAADGSDVSTVTAAGNAIVSTAIAIDPAGNLYYVDATGLRMLAPGAPASTLLVQTGAANVLGTSPRVATVQSIAVLGPKQLVLIGGPDLLVVTMP